MKKSVHLYSILYFALVIVLFSAATLVISHTKAIFNEEYSTISASRSNMAANYISSYLTNYADTLSSLAEVDVVTSALTDDGASLENVDNLMTQSSLLAEDTNYISILNTEKEIIYSTSPQTELSNEITEVLSRAYIGPTISDTIDTPSGSVFIIAAPIFKNKTLIGYIMSEVSINIFAKTHGNLVLNRDSGFILFDGKNSAFQLATGNAVDYDRDKLINGEIDELKSYFIRESDIYFEGLPSGWRVVYLLSGSSLLAAFKTLRLFAAAAFLVMVLVGIFVSYKLKTSIVSPLKEAAEEISSMCENESYYLLSTQSEFKSLSSLKGAVNRVLKGMMNGETAVLFLMRKYAALFEEQKIVFLKWDLNTLRFTISPIYKDIFGIDVIPYGSKSFSPERLGIHPDDAARFNDMIKDIRLGRKTAPANYRKKTADGKYRYFEYIFAIELDNLGSPLSALGCIMDVDRFVRTEIALKRAAELDRYTGVYNKYTYMHKLKKSFADAKSTDENICVSIVRLHNYYVFEGEKLGAGEEALKFVANVISQNIDCTIGRILNDTFGVYSTTDNLIFLCDQIMKELNLGYHSSCLDERKHTKTTSAIFFSDDVSNDFDLLLSKLYQEYRRLKTPVSNVYYFANPNKKDNLNDKKPTEGNT